MLRNGRNPGARARKRRAFLVTVLPPHARATAVYASQIARQERSFPMTPRFNFPEPSRQSVGDKLLDGASKLSIEVWRNKDGRLFGEMEVKTTIGRDSLFGDDDDESDTATMQDENAEAMTFARQLLRAFAAGKDGGE